MTAEVEFKKVVYVKATDWLLSDTAAGWPRAWGILDLPDRLKWVDKPLHDRLLSNWGSCLTKTAAEILKVEDGDLATQLKEQVMAGAKAMVDEHKKNYRWIYTPSTPFSGCVAGAIPAQHHEPSSKNSRASGTFPMLPLSSQIWPIALISSMLTSCNRKPVLAS